MNTRLSNAEKPPVDDPAARAQEFQAVTGSEETTSAEVMLVSAYSVMWVLLLGFIFMTWRRQGALLRRIDEVEKALAKGK